MPYSASQNNHAPTSAANAAAAAANGLFLLSQAHQELTKREEAQARAGLSQDGENIGIEPSATNRRGSKRKIEEPPPPPPKPPAKKTRGGQNSRKKRDSTVSDDEDEDESMSPSTTGAPHPPLSQKSTKDMTDEEKRRNFLERNRQAALKCRQRKKAWLTQLQAKVEFLSAENERLTTALVSSREEISRLNALVGAHPPPGHMQTSHGHQPSGVGTHGLGQNQQPVSVAVSLAGSKQGLMNHNGQSAPAGVAAGGSTRGYGY